MADTASDTYKGKPLSRIIVGLGYGDEGKGMATCYETQKLLHYGLKPVVVRYNGGPQAAHNVRIERMGKVCHHTHQQIGSGGMLAADTVLSAGMLVDPVSIIPEADALSKEINDPYAISRITIDMNAPMVLPLHAMINRTLEERRGNNRHGSTGRGIGVARMCENAWKHDAGINGEPLIVSLLSKPAALANALAWWNGWAERRFDIRLGLDASWYDEQAQMLNMFYKKLQELRVSFVDDTAELVREYMDDSYTGVVFEGSQGIMLDERYGWFPNVTYGDMTQNNAVEIADGRPVITQGIVRTYATRHGFGPFPSESTYDISEDDNLTGKWQGAFRTGLFDMPTFVDICRAVHPDELAVSHMDINPQRYISSWNTYETITHTGADGSVLSVSMPSQPVINSYDSNDEFINIVEQQSGVPVKVLGYGNTTEKWQDA